MSIDSTWLRCPNCFRPLAEVATRVLGCDSGHRFDLSKHGTITLLPPRAPHTVGDSREMLDARSRLLDSGAYAPIAEAIVDAAEAVARSTSNPLRVADLGCGTGYYSTSIAARVPSAIFLLADRSPIAVRLAARALPNASGVVLDLWRPLPIRDDSVDLAIDVFAPRNPPEFARIIRPGGTLVVVVPTDRHLQELRAVGRLLDIPSGKAAQVTEQLAAVGFIPVGRAPVEYVAAFDAAQLHALVAMGPSAHHAAETTTNRSPTPPSPVGAPDGVGPHAAIDVTVSVDVLLFRRG